MGMLPLMRKTHTQSNDRQAILSSGIGSLTESGLRLYQNMETLFPRSFEPQNIDRHQRRDTIIVCAGNARSKTQLSEYFEKKQRLALVFVFSVGFPCR